MGFTKEDVTAAAKQDLADRLGVSEESVEELSVTGKDFPDMSLGAPADDEMSTQMIATGWEIGLKVNGKSYEYRADKYQLRAKGFEGKNYLVK